jgi:hypothetical protein
MNFIETPLKIIPPLRWLNNREERKFRCILQQEFYVISRGKSNTDGRAAIRTRGRDRRGPQFRL